jgi:hypothetical protein
MIKNRSHLTSPKGVKMALPHRSLNEVYVHGSLLSKQNRITKNIVYLAQSRLARIQEKEGPGNKELGRK